MKGEVESSFGEEKNDYALLSSKVACRRKKVIFIKEKPGRSFVV